MMQKLYAEYEIDFEKATDFLMNYRKSIDYLNPVSLVDIVDKNLSLKDFIELKLDFYLWKNQ